MIISISSICLSCKESSKAESNTEVTSIVSLLAQTIQYEDYSTVDLSFIMLIYHKTLENVLCRYYLNLPNLCTY